MYAASGGLPQIGHFAGLMPDGLYRESRYLGIEMDGFTARIAQLLYPGQTVRQADYVKHRVPAAFFDLAIGNPPFGSIPIVDDPQYLTQPFLKTLTFKKEPNGSKFKPSACSVP